MKTIIATALTALALSTTAQADTAKDYCYALHNYAESVAEGRDSGLSEPIAIQVAVEHGGESALDLLDVVVYVYDYPHEPVADEAYEVYRQCMATYAEEF